MQQKVSASSKPQGIAKYILDQVLVNENYTLMKNWNEDSAAVFPDAVYCAAVDGFLGHRHSTNRSRHCPKRRSIMLEKWQRKINRLVHGPQHSNSKARA